MSVTHCHLHGSLHSQVSSAFWHLLNFIWRPSADSARSTLSSSQPKAANPAKLFCPSGFEIESRDNSPLATFQKIFRTGNTDLTEGKYQRAQCFHALINNPYFLNTKGKEMNLSWEQYGLPSIDKIRTNELPDFKITTKEEYFEWWKNKRNSKGSDDIAFNDVLGEKIILDSAENKKGRATDFFKEHILKKSNENRFEYATEVEDILKKPDEVWLNTKDKNTKTYLKFYETGTIKLVVNENNIAETLFLINKNDNSESNKIGAARKGILLHR